MISRLSKRFLSLAFRPALRQPLVFRRFDTIRIQPKYRLEFTCTAQIEKGFKLMLASLIYHYFYYLKLLLRLLGSEK